MTVVPFWGRSRAGSLSRLWQRRFGADPSINGKPISLAGEPRTMIGVLARDFAFDPPAELYLPFQADPNSTNHTLPGNFSSTVHPRNRNSMTQTNS